MDLTQVNQLLLDIEKTIADAGNLPDFTDKAATAAWAGRIAPDIVNFIYDAGGLGTVHAALCAAAAPGSAPLGKIGDGSIMRWLVANGPAIMAFIMQIVAVIPKAPAPAPLVSDPT